MQCFYWYQGQLQFREICGVASLWCVACFNDNFDSVLKWSLALADIIYSIYRYTASASKCTDG